MNLIKSIKTTLNLLKIAVIATASLVTVNHANAQDGDYNSIIVATDKSYIPFEFPTPKGYSGFDIELWDMIADDVGIHYRLQPMDFNQIFKSLENGNAQIAIAGISITPERQQVVDFSEPYFNSGLALMVAQDNDSIKSFKDLETKKVGVKRASTANQYLTNNLPNATARLFNNIDTNHSYVELATSRLDAIVHDEASLLYFAQNQGKNKVKIVEVMQTNENYGIAFAKGSSLIATINNALQRIKASGQYDRLYQKWFGQQPNNN